MNMRLAIFLLLFLAPMVVRAYDCSMVKPFVQVGSQAANVSVYRFFWKSEQSQYVQNEEKVCEISVNVPVFDIRGREKEAYYCLLPRSEQIVNCNLKFNGKPSEIVTAPTVWIRTVASKSLWDYHFHAFLSDPSNQSQFVHDVFSRTMLADLNPVGIYLDGAFRDGLPNFQDGYFVEVQFEK